METRRFRTHLARDQHEYRKKLTVFWVFNACCAFVAIRYGSETALLVALVGDRIHGFLWMWE